MSPSRIALTGVASALIAAGTVALPATSASAVSSDIVISEVYGGGGNSGATLTNDFVELRNAGTEAVDVDGWSVQYASSSGSSWQTTALSGSIAPGQHFLVQQATGSGGTTPLPQPDATGSISMSSSNGKIALVTNAAALTCGGDCDTFAGVKDFVGYGSANDFETAPAPGLSNTTSAVRAGADTDNNAADFVEGEPSPTNSAGDGPPPPPPPPPGIEGLEIHDIQGAGHLSPYAGERVDDVPGVVTAVGDSGFWMQSPALDDDVATSEGVLVYTNSTPRGVEVGDSVEVSAEVEEYRGDNDNLTLTELSEPTVAVVATDAALPPVQVVGPGGRVPPATVIDDDANGNVERTGSFDATTDGIDFWESMEGMRVGIDNAQVTGPTSPFGEIPIVPVGSGVRTSRGGIAVSAEDFNPERVFVDDTLVDTPTLNVGDVLAGRTVGVLDYSFTNFKLQATSPASGVPGGLPRETTPPARGSELAIASYNVENLDPSDSRAKFDALAAQIVHNLAAPDVLGLEEVQDNDGPDRSDVTAADRTLDLLTEAIVRAGGPVYEWRQIDPVNLEEGGQPGGNIRVAFLFRPDRGVEFIDRGTPSSTQATGVFTDDKGAVHLTRSPGRIAPQSEAFDDSRVPLVGEFRWKGNTFFAIANHFSSKGGDDPLFGRWQPPTQFTAAQRHLQAQEVRDFVDSLLRAEPDARVAVVGDINDFEFSETTDILVGSGATALTDLPRTLPANERYTYVFEGNSQVLDHILLSPRFVEDTYSYDIVHVNSEYADQISDHDPQVVRLGNPNVIK